MTQFCGVCRGLIKAQQVGGHVISFQLVLNLQPSLLYAANQWIVTRSLLLGHQTTSQDWVGCRISLRVGRVHLQRMFALHATFGSSSDCNRQHQDDLRKLSVHNYCSVWGLEACRPNSSVLFSAPLAPDLDSKWIMWASVEVTHLQSQHAHSGREASGCRE